MSAHRQHAFDLPSRPQAPPLREVNTGRASVLTLLILLGAIAAAALIIIGSIVGSGGAPAVLSTPVAPAQIVTSDLPPLDARARALQGRLEVWRAGYEAALDDGCKPQPLLSSPIGLRP